MSLHLTLDLRRVQSILTINCQLVQNGPDRQEIRRDHLVAAGHQCVTFTSLLRSSFLPPFPCWTKLAQGLPTWHEIIIFYLAAALRGVKFHPDESCTQIRVGASQMSTPNQTALFHAHTMTTSGRVLGPAYIMVFSVRQCGLRI
jgi:hypothetical protein